MRQNRFGGDPRRAFSINYDEIVACRGTGQDGSVRLVTTNALIAINSQIELGDLAEDLPASQLWTALSDGSGHT